MSIRKLACGIICLAAISAAVDAQAAVPKVKVAGDTITVTVPDGTASGTNRLVLCWGATDAGSEFVDWGNSSILSENVTSTGGVWTVSAAAKGIAANSALCAFIGIPYKVVNYIESTTGKAGGGGNNIDKTLAIKTGIAAKTGLHVKTKMRWLALADTDLCGGRKAPGDSTRIFPVHIYNNMWFLGYGASTANSVACSKDVDYEVETKLYLGSQTMSVDGSQIYALSDSTPVDTTGECAAFAVYYPTRQYPIGCASHARCYYLKMWENGNTTDNPEGDLVRDFIPVKDSLGHGALYDQVTKRTFQPTYTGADPIEYMDVGDETGDVVYSMDIVSPTVVAGFSSLYVQDGLVACWDGIENAGAGVHDSAATVWEDIVGGYKFALTGVTVDDDRMTFAGTETSYGTLDNAGTTATFGAAKNGTMEIVYASRTGTGTQVLLQSTSGTGLAFGFFKGQIIASTVTGSTFPFALDTTTNSVSIRYSSCKPVSPICTNGWALAAGSGSDAWGNPSGTTTFIGVRATKQALTHFPGSIYCIRLYSRQLTDAEIAANYSVDQFRFNAAYRNSALMVSSAPGSLGSPSPSFGMTIGLSAGETREVTCGALICTNDTKSFEYRCAGWKLYNANDEVVDSGVETTFTYTHPSPAEYRRLEWQWEVTKDLTDHWSYSDSNIAVDDASVRRIKNNGCYVYVFTNVEAALTVKVKRKLALTDSLLVGGGGGGGLNGGGGGAGGVLRPGVDAILKPGEMVALLVGAGGAGAPPNNIGTNGCNTTLTIGNTTYTAFGGGRGGGNVINYSGASGGSGGGSFYTGAGGAGVDGQGHEGATDSVSNSSGGGGGAGHAGYATDEMDGEINKSRCGGDGIASCITGVEVYYGGGGGGIGGLGGLGGGGDGHSAASPGPGSDGTDGLGGGGGASRNNYRGGRGGNGTVILTLRNIPTGFTIFIR